MSDYLDRNPEEVVNFAEYLDYCASGIEMMCNQIIATANDFCRQNNDVYSLNIMSAYIQDALKTLQLFDRNSKVMGQKEISYEKAINLQKGHMR